METRFGLALGSGGARGLAHVGVLKVLEEEGLVPTCIAGTSMGSMIGALYAECLDAGELARRLWTYVGDEEFMASWRPFVEDDELDDRRGLLGELRRSLERKILTFKTFSSPSQQSADALFEPLRRLFTVENIEDLQLPFACVAADLFSGEARIFENGYLISAIYASSAIPGVFPPLPLGGQLLVDGGGPYRVPVTVARNLGADFVMAIDIPSFAPAKEKYKTGLDVLMRSDAIARMRLNKIVLERADFVLRPDVERFHWANFAAADPIREAGEAAMREAMPALREAMHRPPKGLRTRLGERLLRWGA